MKKCPFCAEEIQDEAKLCRFCHMDLIANKPILDPVSNAATKIVSSGSSISDGVRIGIGMFIVLPIMLVIIIFILKKLAIFSDTINNILVVAQIIFLTGGILYGLVIFIKKIRRIDKFPSESLKKNEILKLSAKNGIWVCPSCNENNKEFQDVCSNCGQEIEKN